MLAAGADSIKGPAQVILETECHHSQEWQCSAQHMKRGQGGLEIMRKLLPVQDLGMPAMLEGAPSRATPPLRRAGKQRGLVCGPSSDESSNWHPGAPCAKRVRTARRALHAGQGTKAMADAVQRNRMARHRHLRRKQVTVCWSNLKLHLVHPWLWLAELSHEPPKVSDRLPSRCLVCFSVPWHILGQGMTLLVAQ